MIIIVNVLSLCSIAWAWGKEGFCSGTKVCFRGNDWARPLESESSVLAKWEKQIKKYPELDFLREEWKQDSLEQKWANEEHRLEGNRRKPTCFEGSAYERNFKPERLGY